MPGMRNGIHPGTGVLFRRGNYKLRYAGSASVFNLFLPSGSNRIKILVFRWIIFYPPGVTCSAYFQNIPVDMDQYNGHQAKIKLYSNYLYFILLTCYVKRISIEIENFFTHNRLYDFPGPAKLFLG